MLTNFFFCMKPKAINLLVVLRLAQHILALPVLLYCNILLYCNTDVVIIKPVTGRASMCSASLKTTRRLIALGFHTEKDVCQHLHSSDPVSVHTIRTIHCNIVPYAIY